MSALNKMEPNGATVMTDPFSMRKLEQPIEKSKAKKVGLDVEKVDQLKKLRDHFDKRLKSIFERD